MLQRIIASIKNHPFVWVAGFIVAVVLPLLTFFDVPVPKPAWSQDIQRLEVQQLKTHIQLLEDQKERAELRKLEVLREQDQIKRAKQPIPDFYLREQAAIEQKIERLDSDLKASRGRTVELSK